MVVQFAFHDLDLSPAVSVAQRQHSHQTPYGHLGLTTRATNRLFTIIGEQCDLDFGLVCGEYRLEHRRPEDDGRNFYALTRSGWLVGVEHYQDCPYSLKRVQWLLALVLRERGWTPEAVKQVWCDDEWPYAAHRLPRLFKAVETRDLYRLAGMHQRAQRHAHLQPMSFERWAWATGSRGAAAWRFALDTNHTTGDVLGWVNRARHLQWLERKQLFSEKGE